MKKIQVECNSETCIHVKDGECTYKALTICDGICMSVEEPEEEI